MNNEDINRRLAKLDALEAGGVDNWEFYDESLKDWHAENHVEECICECLSGINEVLVDADVEEPAGPGTGYSISYDESSMKQVLRKLLNDIQD